MGGVPGCVSGGQDAGVLTHMVANDTTYNTPQNEIRKARKRAAFSVGLNLLLAVGKAVAGILGGSSALIGDAITVWQAGDETACSTEQALLEGFNSSDAVEVQSGEICEFSYPD